MKATLAAAIALLAMLSSAPVCRAWNSTGHEIIAQVALDHLSTDAKTRIMGVLRNHPRLQEDLLHDASSGKDPDAAIFLRAATWPDMVKFPAHPLRQAENHPRWHFVDYPFDVGDAHGPQPAETWDGRSDPANILQAMQKMERDLTDPNVAKDRKAIDLCWVEHLVGDAHQPLHTTSLFSAEYPVGDQGGNLMFIKNEQNMTINLHAYWDDLPGMTLNPDEIHKAADRVEREYPPEQNQVQLFLLEGAPEDAKPKLVAGDVILWAKESFAIAREKVYLNGTLPHETKENALKDPNSAPSLPPDYQKNAEAVVDHQMVLAGYRLAAVLEDLAPRLGATEAAGNAAPH